MKVVKLNRRFKKFKENGHTVAFRFKHWSAQAQEIEQVCSKKLGGSAWNPTGPWCAYFGERNGRNAVRPYWITFRNETDATLVLLSADLTKIG